MGSREELADKVAASLNRRIENGQLPHTLGIFGGWGTGKTTFLALLAERFEKSSKHKVVYFNSWKYAGFMEIVPSLIYKILQYGVEGDSMERSEAARRRGGGWPGQTRVARAGRCRSPAGRHG